MWGRRSPPSISVQRFPSGKRGAGAAQPIRQLSAIRYNVAKHLRSLSQVRAGAVQPRKTRVCPAGEFAIGAASG